MPDVYVRFFYRPRSRTWSRLRLDVQPNIKATRRKSRRKATPTNKIILFRTAIESYVDSLNVIGVSFPPTVFTVPRFTDARFGRRCREIIDKFGAAVKETKDGAIYRIDDTQAVHLVEAFEGKVDEMRYVEYAPKFFLIGLVSLYDDYLSKLLFDLFSSTQML